MYVDFTINSISDSVEDMTAWLFFQSDRDDGNAVKSQ